jgi:hypothetical protein
MLRCRIVSPTKTSMKMRWAGEVYVPEAPPPPAPLQPIKSHDKGVKQRRNPMRALKLLSVLVRADKMCAQSEELGVQWSRVTKGLAQVTLDNILRIEVQFFEQLWRDCDTSSCTYFLQMLCREIGGVAVCTWQGSASTTLHQSFQGMRDSTGVISLNI